MREGAPAPEALKAPTKAEVVASLVKDPEKPDAPEDHSILDAYVAQQEKEVRTRRDWFMLQLEIGQIYRDAGLADAAADILRPAKQMAIKEKEYDSYTKLMKVLNDMDADPMAWAPDPSPLPGGSPA